ncbi:MAG: cytochrome B5 [Deltaproteobacteria bacterium]|nr:cytochrome B5 [Deltaproteobacteria bacterium]
MEKKFSKKEIERFDGKDGRPAYIAYNGKVYDVTGSVFWTDGAHLESHFAGTDLTSELDNAPHGEEIFEGIARVGILED